MNRPSGDQLMGAISDEDVRTDSSFRPGVSHGRWLDGKYLDWPRWSAHCDRLEPRVDRDVRAVRPDRSPCWGLAGHGSVVRQSAARAGHPGTPRSCRLRSRADERSRSVSFRRARYDSTNGWLMMMTVTDPSRRPIAGKCFVAAFSALLARLLMEGLSRLGRPAINGEMEYVFHRVPLTL